MALAKTRYKRNKAAKEIGGRYNLELIGATDTRKGCHA